MKIVKSCSLRYRPIIEKEVNKVTQPAVKVFNNNEIKELEHKLSEEGRLKYSKTPKLTRHEERVFLDNLSSVTWYDLKTDKEQAIADFLEFQRNKMNERNSK